MIARALPPPAADPPGVAYVGSNNLSLVNTTFLVWMGKFKLEGFRLQIHGRASTLTAGAGAAGIQESSVQGRAGVVGMAARNPFGGSPIMLLPTYGGGPGAPADLRS